MDMKFFTLICCKNCVVFEKTENEWKRGRGWSIIFVYQQHEEHEEDIGDEEGRPEGPVGSCQRRVIEVTEDEPEQSKDRADKGAVVSQLKAEGDQCT